MLVGCVARISVSCHVHFRGITINSRLEEERMQWEDIKARYKDLSAIKSGEIKRILPCQTLPDHAVTELLAQVVWTALIHFPLTMVFEDERDT